ncbi:hypothetical protein V8C86DRAFT_1622536 [Haematococcus lacustris]
MTQGKGLAAAQLERLWADLWTSGCTIVAIAAFLFSIGTLCVKALEPAVPAFEVAFVPSAVCWALTHALARKSGLPLLADDARTHRLTLLRAGLGAASLILYYCSLAELPMNDAVTLFFCSPVISAALELAILGNSLTPGTLAGCVFTLLGVVLVMRSECLEHLMHPPSPGYILGSALALAAATCNAAAFLVVRLLSGRQSAVVITWWYCLVVTLAALVPLLAAYPSPPLAPTRPQAALLACICAMQFSGQLLLNRGFQLVTPTRGSAINVLQVLFAYVWAVTVLHESFNWVSVAGGGCVALGVVCVALLGASPAPAAPSALREQLHSSSSSSCGEA